MSVVDLIGGMVGLYKVVPVNEAHVRVMFDKTEMFSSRVMKNEKGGQQPVEGKRSYWVIPYATKIHRLPLTNIRIDVPDIKLNDKKMAKFVCEIVCFVNIVNPILAAERTDITIAKDAYEERLLGVKNVADDLRTIIESLGRSVATKQGILDIYMNRELLDVAVVKELSTRLPKWGLELVSLEIIELRDAVNSTIITDIEQKIAAEINADRRVTVAEQSKRAEISEAGNKKDAELAKAKNEQEWRQQQILKDQNILSAEQTKNMEVAKKTQAANEQVIDAERKLTVGRATIDKEATVQRAEGEKQKTLIEAEGIAAQTKSVGEAEAGIIKAKKVAEAEGTEKLALAQQKFGEASTRIRVIEANRDVKLAEAEAYKQGLSNATISIVSGQSQDLVNGGLLGQIKLGGKEGVALQQFMQGLDPANKKKAEDLLATILPGVKSSNKE